MHASGTTTAAFVLLLLFVLGDGFTVMGYDRIHASGMMTAANSLQRELSGGSSCFCDD